MNHGKSFRKLGKKTSHRNAILNNLMASLIKEERVITTKVKAKEVQSLVEKTITRAKSIPYKEYQDNFSKRKALSEKMKEMRKKGEKINLTPEEQKLLDEAAAVVHGYKMLSRRIREDEVISKLVKDIALRVKDRKGGYTRVLHLEQRRGDASQMVVLELVDRVS